MSNWIFIPSSLDFVKAGTVNNNCRPVMKFSLVNNLCVMLRI